MVQDSCIFVVLFYFPSYCLPPVTKQRYSGQLANQGSGTLCPNLLILTESSEPDGTVLRLATYPQSSIANCVEYKATLIKLLLAPLGVRDGDRKDPSFGCYWSVYYEHSVSPSGKGVCRVMLRPWLGTPQKLSESPNHSAVVQLLV